MVALRSHVHIGVGVSVGVAVGVGVGGRDKAGVDFCACGSWIRRWERRQHASAATRRHRAGPNVKAEQKEKAEE